MGQVALFGADNTVQLLQNGLVFADGQDNNSGRRSRNFIRNRSAYRNTNGWVVSGACTVTRTTTAVEIVDGVASLKFAAGAAADYVKNAFTINNIQKSQPLNISFDFITQSGTAGDWDVTVYDVTAAATIVVSAPAQGGSGGNLAAGNGTFNAFFISTTNTSYELRIVRKGGTGTFSVANFDVFQQQVRVGAAVTDWQNYTVSTSGWGAVGTYYGKFSRSGDSGTFKVELALTSTPAGGFDFTEAQLFGSLTGLTVDLTKLNDDSTGLPVVGIWAADDETNTFYSGIVAYNRANSRFVLLTANAQVSNTVPFTWGSTDSVQITVTVPIANWSSNVQMADRALEEYASNSSTATATNDSTSFAYGSAGNQIQSVTTGVRRSVNFQSPKQVTDKFFLELWDGNSAHPWVDAASQSIGGVGIGFNYQNGRSYGIGLSSSNLSTETVTVTIGDYVYNSSTYGAVGTTWAASGANAWYWRVRKVSSGAQIAGAISSINIVSDQQGVAIPTGYLGERLSSYGGPTTVASNATTYNVTSLTLTAGVWDAYAVTYYNIANLTSYETSIVETTLTQGTIGDTRVSLTQPTGISEGSQIVPNVRVLVPVGTTKIIYITTQVVSSGGGSNIRGRLSAVRVR